jgi:transcriptional regulator with AAA-type ATPase domain
MKLSKITFTGADKDHKGLLEEADNGILFLDEVHHLSKLVQAKLMKAFQTDNENKMSIRKMGDLKEIKVECKLIFATNKSIDELRNKLLPDFYDRIVQHVIYLPSLRETIEDREQDWSLIWNNLKFSQPCPNNEELINWLKDQPLYGNYRDLQKIALYYNIFNNFKDDTLMLIAEKTPFEYAKNEFEKYHSLNTKNISSDLESIFTSFKNATSIDAEVKFKLQEWALNTYGSREKAAEQLEITVKTLNDWKNKKKSKKDNDKNHRKIE